MKVEVGFEEVEEGRGAAGVRREIEMERRKEVEDLGRGVRPDVCQLKVKQHSD